MSRRSLRLPRHTLLATALAIALLPVQAAAQTEAFRIWITDGGDPHPLNPTTCSLRQALNTVSLLAISGTCQIPTNPGYAMLEFAPWLANTRILLEHGELSFRSVGYPFLSRVIVRGHGVVVDARQASRVLRVEGERGTGAPEASMLTFHDMTFTGGRAAQGPNGAGAGAGMFVLGLIELSLIRSRVIGNVADDNGGGVFMLGATTYTYPPTLNLIDSTVEGNRGFGGGGVFLYNASAYFLRSTISHNTSEHSGAGVSATFGPMTWPQKPLVFWNSTITGNEILSEEYGWTGSGVYQVGENLELRNTTIVGNRGGMGQGLHSEDPSPGGSLIANSVITDNGTNPWEGAFGGDHVHTPGATLVAGTVSGSMLDSRARGHVEGTGNLFGDDPRLGPLADNGGYVKTMRPLDGSPLIDAGDDATCMAPAGSVHTSIWPHVPLTILQSLDTVTYDARLGERPQGAHCDIGAFEVRQGSFTIAASVTGQGRVDALPLPTGTGSSGGIVQCTSAGGADCNATFVGEHDASILWLTATPAPGWRLADWSGDCTATLIDPESARLSIDGTRSCNAAFAIDTHAIAGFVQGLAGSGLALRLNGGDALPITADGRFVFEAPLDHGTPYSVTVATQPSGQTCTVTQGSGVADGTMQDTAVMCSAATMPATVSITIDDGTTLIGHGPTPGYTITVRNDGDQHAFGVIVTTAATPAVALDGLTWSCDRACSPTGGAGHVATRIDVGAHDQRYVYLRGSIVPFPGGTLSVTA